MIASAILDETHDAGLESWVASANDPASDFPIQNLPFGRFRRAAAKEPWRIGIAIGDQVLDLALARERGRWEPRVQAWLEPLAAGDLNRLLAEGGDARRAVRRALSRALAAGSEQQAALGACLVAQADIELGLPCEIRNYTDFYTGIHHATAVGKLFRPDNPLLPNYQWVPIGYHGRASSIVASGTPVVRPWGQLKGPSDETPRFAPSARLDFELELGVVIAQGNALGEPLSMAQAEDALAGVVLLNDWSARDIQPWEYQPLGPFLSKNFATTISPWLVTMEALAPFRCAFERPAGDPHPLPYLDSADNRAQGAFDIALSARLRTAAMRERGEAPAVISRSNFREAAYWTLAQMATHHASNGCNLQPGDLLGTGTQSGPQPGQGGSLLELSAGGREALRLPDGSERHFLEDGDELWLEAHAMRPGARRIGFGACCGEIRPARPGG
ncbi:fumarylacetoacetase [Caldimonas sp. KR1-144]|uniref:fumarylacetoacetase n=1 Tax=Caldimonas sp. KR1-144 TaxID=3400911 RepID=UPI003BFFE8C6